MGGEHSVVAVSSNVKMRFDEYCYKLGLKQQPVVDKLLLTLMEQGISDDELRLAFLLKDGIMRVTFDKNFKRLMNDMHVFGIYADSNMEKQIANMANLDDETEDIIRRGYALGKGDAEDIKKILKEAIAIRERMKDEKQPKQLGKTPDEWRKAHQKPECRHLRTKLAVVRGDRRMRRCLDCGLEIWSEKRD